MIRGWSPSSTTSDLDAVMINDSRNVLVVEDDGLIGLLLEELLQGFGLRVVGPAFTSAIAEDIASHAAVDFALLDVRLGEDTSFATATILRARSIPFAFLTGYDAKRLPAEFQGAATLQKPFNPERLQLLLRRFGLLDTARQPVARDNCSLDPERAKAA